MNKHYCYTCASSGYHMRGCPDASDDPEDAAEALDGDYEPNLPEDDDREYDYQADLDRRWEAVERAKR